MEEDKKKSRSNHQLCEVVAFLFAASMFVVGLYFIIKDSNKPVPVPAVELASMDFTVLNITRTRLSAKWDLSLRIPYDLTGYYICLQGDLQASLLYKNLTLATSSPQKYYGLTYGHSQVLKVSAEVSGEDIGGLIGENIMKDVKEKKEVQFGSQFSLTDCREKSKGVMRYVCNDVNLRFQPDSQTKATVFESEDYPKCINVS